MSGHREQRVNEEVKRELTAVLRQLKDPRISGMVSVLKTNVTKDLKFCKVYISVFGDESSKKDVLKGLNSAKGFIRKEIASALSLRVTPEFIFEIDNSLEEGNRILKMMESLEYHEE